MLKYEVTVYEREMVLGGQARNQMDPAEFDAEIEAQFQFEEFSRHLSETVTDLEALRADYDAVYVATGADGADFGLEMDPDGAFATRTPGVFIGGSLTGGDSMKALADGLAAISKGRDTFKASNEWDRACRSGGSGKRGIVYGGRGDAGDHALPEVFV